MLGGARLHGGDFDDAGSVGPQRPAQFAVGVGLDVSQDPPAGHGLGDEIAKQVLGGAGGGGPDLGEAQFA